MLSAASAVLAFTLAWNPTPAPPVELVSVQRVTGSADFVLLLDAVLGQGRPGVTSRDALAYTLLGLGYAVKDTADIVSGRISKQAIDTAHAMRLTGRSREATDYLNRQYRRVAVAATAPQPMASTMSARPLITTMTATPTMTTSAKPTLRAQLAIQSGIAAPIEAAILKYARLHAVDPALIRAIIGAESQFAANARSSAGAIGLMQLMPATARALGVNPHITDENIEGGVRYLAELLRTFGGIELALVAYNAGPELARRYDRGEVSLYGETRAYIQQVLTRMRSAR